MLHCITGTPGSQKTAFVVTKIDEMERKNKLNLIRNKTIFEHNRKLFDLFRDDFRYYEYEVGSAHELKLEIEYLADDYFDFILQDFDDLRPDYYYLRTNRFNEIVDRINEREGHQDFQLLQPVRTIYSNINALKVPYCRALVYDWRDAPDGSWFAIDEVQLVEPYKDHKVKHEMILDMTIHRHRGFDFYFITQSPSYLHPVIKELIGVHQHVTRPYGRTPKIYQWGSVRQYPNTFINKLNCESKFSFKAQDRIFKLYKSTTINTHEKRMPAGIIPVALIIGIAVIMLLWGLYDKVKLDNEQKARNAQNTTQTQNTTTTDTAQNTTTTQQNFELNQECRKAVNVEKPECVKWFDDQSKQVNHGSVNHVAYDPNQPFNTDAIQNSVSYEVSAKPQFSGCAKYEGKYYAYTQQGTRLNVSEKDCKNLIENGDRPFNYFQRQNQTERVSTSELTQNAPNTTSL
ncbi:hypothetical protein GWP85_03180 [Acinetobacter beijerinckii]|uniref:zonular occludens toxin domain-containing protein n=1 Tax=Acinetobacter beijerinckii TaxID=262668 RepID=UPI0023DDA717|nr:zonular occludens toxin domain-containing protein [Acinetobacter beijerinckii]MDF2416518.1 hypothetical protein [Acinetobacter beijerinckii]